MITERSTRETGTATSQAVDTLALVVDDRPLVRAGVLTALGERADDEVIEADLADAVNLVEAYKPQVLIVVLHGDDPEPFRTIATTKALRDDLHVLVLADEVTAADLREAVVAGADSFLLTSAPLAELERAVETTAGGERVVSPEVAMHLVGTWRPDDPDNKRAQLTPRELDVLELLTEGLTNAQIADRLDVSPRTIKTHVQNLLAKLDVPDRTGAVARGFRLGLIR